MAAAASHPAARFMRRRVTTRRSSKPWRLQGLNIDSCAIGSWGGWRPSPAGDVTATGAVSAALAIQQHLTSLGVDVPDDRACAFESACTWAT